MTTWKWIDDKTVEIAAGAETLRFEAATVQESEWTEFYNKIQDEGDALVILQKAGRAFEMGFAEYSNARENLKNLLREARESAAAVWGIAQDIDVFFTKPGIVKAFGLDRQGLISFALEFVVKASVRPAHGE